MSVGAEVVLLDPDPHRAQARALWLRAEGARVRVCADVAAALDALGEAVPQLLLLAEGAQAADLLGEVASDGAAPVPVCILLDDAPNAQTREWLATVADDAVGDPQSDPFAAARLKAVLRRSGDLASLREDLDRTRFALRLAGTWSDQDDFEARLRGLAPTLARIPAVRGYQLVLRDDRSGALEVAVSQWPEEGPPRWPDRIEEGDPLHAEVGAAGEGDEADVTATAAGHELRVPVTPGGDDLGLLRVLLVPGPAPSPADRIFYRDLGRVLGANVALWRSMHGLQVRHGRLESAFVARFQELRAANRRLGQLNRMKDEFLGVTTHDLKGPLSVILGQGQLLDRGLLGPLTEKQAKAAAAVLRQASRIRATVEELRERAQRSSEVEARREDVDLVQLVDRAVEAAVGEAQRAGVMLVREVAVDELVHFGDPVQIREAFDALITRSVRATEPGAEVRCALRHPVDRRRRIELVVDGGGVQLEGAEASRALRGGDPALTACRHAAREHGGQFWLEESPGGVRYTLSLPVPLRGRAPGRPGRAQVVLVQADAALADAVERSLAGRFEVTREVARRVPALLADAPPDALILGVGAGSASESLGLLDTIAQDDDLAAVPLVVHTALPEEQLQAHLGGVRSWTTVAAPVAGRVLLRAVEAVLEGRRGPPLSLPGFLDRLRRAITEAGGQPVSVLRVRGDHPLEEARLEDLARWLEPRTRTADRLGRVDDHTVLLLLPGAPSWVPERIASDLVDAGADGETAVLPPGCGLSWVSWGAEDEIDGPEELLARLDEPEYCQVRQVPPSPAVD